MIVRVRNLRLHVDEEEALLVKKAAQRLGVNPVAIEDLKIARKAIDARRTEVYFTYHVDVKLKWGMRLPRSIFRAPDISVVEPVKEEPLILGSERLTYSPLIVGAGPAGLFCALTLAEYGYKPVVVERGRDLRRRVEDVDRFWQYGELDPESNVQFGEGGAGTFSDGKLTTRIGDVRVEKVLKTLVSMGAPPEIEYVKNPHVGTDRLREIVYNMRRRILELGGEIYFEARLTDLIAEGGHIKGAVINDAIEVDAEVLVLAVGHSARDVYRLLYRKGVSLTPKAFAVGVRIEHPQALIDRIQYGKYAGHPRLPAAEYRITYQDEETGRNVYSFCMCPGGYVIASASGENQVVVNGMSYCARDSGVANSALLVTVSPKDWDENILGGVALQEKMEKAAYLMGGGGYRAPAQKVVDFLMRQESSSFDKLQPTYRPGVIPTNLDRILPDFIAEPLRRALIDFDRRMPGFAGKEAVLTGVETRSSAPLRILRGEDFQSVSLKGLYPAGEGAGYAGGIVSAAVDGIKVAEQIIRTYAPPAKKTVLKDNRLSDARNL